MDDDKDDKPLFQKAIEIVKDVASSVTEVVTSAPPSQRTEAVPAVKENLVAAPMTAEEIAHHAAADTQPVMAAKKIPRKKAAAPSLSGRITPTYDIPVPDSPMPAPKRKKAKKSVKKPAKAAKQTTVKKAMKKSKAKKAVKKTAKKSKKTAKKTVKKSSKKKKSKR
jgi:hypothetical protein